MKLETAQQRSTDTINRKAVEQTSLVSSAAFVRNYETALDLNAP
jgi:hypothetical protein